MQSLESMLERRDRATDRAEAARTAAATAAERSTHLLGELLDTLTWVSDTNPAVPARLDWLRRLSALVGRDPAIEEAKQVLRATYGIDGVEAFDLITRMSQNTNRRARDIAHAIVEGGAGLP